MAHIVYIRMKKKIKVNPNDDITLGDIADITTTTSDKSTLENTTILLLNKDHHSVAIIDCFHVLEKLNEQFRGLDFELIGHNETIVYIVTDKKKSSMLLVTLVWILLFVGTAMTIINFHYDVNMLEVHQKIHYMFTGNKVKQPLFIQIPYSLGLGVGMVLFLNYIFKKKINDEPSPLEIELFKYEQDLHDYTAYYENELNDEAPHHSYD